MKTECVVVPLGPGKARTLVVEPWGVVLTVEGGAAIEVVFEGPDEGVPEVEEGADGSVTVYGWPGSTVHVAQDGREVYRSSAVVPRGPHEVSVRRFLELTGLKSNET
jgi:hypothetical protein